MSRNVDIIAIALLLLGIAAYAQARKCAVMAVNRHGVYWRPNAPMVVVPPPPPPPRVWVMRD